MVVNLGALGRIGTLVSERLVRRDIDAEQITVPIAAIDNEALADLDDDFRYWWAVGVGM